MGRCSAAATLVGLLRLSRGSSPRDVKRVVILWSTSLQYIAEAVPEKPKRSQFGITVADEHRGRNAGAYLAGHRGSPLQQHRVICLGMHGVNLSHIAHIRPDRIAEASIMHRSRQCTEEEKSFELQPKRAVSETTARLPGLQCGPDSVKTACLQLLHSAGAGTMEWTADMTTGKAFKSH